MAAGITGLVVLASLAVSELPQHQEADSGQKVQPAAAVAGRSVKEEIQFGAEHERLFWRRFQEWESGSVHLADAAAAVSQAAVESEQPVSAPAAEPEIVQPEPAPNEQVIVAAAEPTPEPEAEPAEVPVVVSVEAPGSVKVSTITIEPITEPTPPPNNQNVISTETQMASIQGGCTIMGTSYTYLDQMVRYYKDNQVYPDFYQNSDAPTIEAFCQIYIEEAQAEGVRAEVAFCQAMKETGFLRYLGDVRIEQFNFAGIGATGGGVQGNYFASVRDGVRAQIQHLKAYASTDTLNNACVDPRFYYVNRGTTPFVEWLGIHENPYGGGWAAAENYGSSIVNDYIVKLFSR